jgi:hypothetical protein
MKPIYFWYILLGILLVIGGANTVLPGVLISTRFLTIDPQTIADQKLREMLTSNWPLIFISSLITYLSILLMILTTVFQVIKKNLELSSDANRRMKNLFPTGSEKIGRKELLKGLGIEESTLHKIMVNIPEKFSYQDAEKLLKFITRMDKKAGMIGGSFTKIG